MHAERDIVISNPSVRLSVTLCYYIETNAHVVKLFPLPGIGAWLVFLALRRHYKILRGHPSAKALNTRTGWENFVIFDSNLRLSRKRYEKGPWLLWNTEVIGSWSINVGSKLIEWQQASSERDHPLCRQHHLSNIVQVTDPEPEP